MNRDLTFYEAAAQLLPVLFLALVVELRSEGEQPRRRSSPRKWFAARMLIVTLLVLGEALAIRALLTKDPLLLGTSPP
jgi:hypothetical protein